jgi:hypothetical protein
MVANLALEFLHTPDFNAVSNSLQGVSDLQALGMVWGYHTNILIG